MTSTLSSPPRIDSARPAPRRSPYSALTAVLTLPEMRWAGLSLALFALGAVLQALGAPSWSWWASYLLCYAAGGSEPGLAGLRAARDKILDVDLLMVVAAVGAAAIGQVFDGALLIVTFATSGALEALATRRTADSVRALLDLAPERATRLGPGGDEQVVDTAELGVGDTVLIRPGERIGADAQVAQGPVRSTRPQSPGSRCRWSSSAVMRCSPGR